ncbi:MFS transporter [Vibrio gangliei]|uniref:MFS transporter n=1 Tax=Vibrio gangliei TaxID=2077090 RepID=UPI000D0220B5|nr:MFS transporter [Vibrio gangliei]
MSSIRHTKRMSSKKIRHMGLLIVGVMLLAANLRAPVTGVAPMIDMISESFSLSATQAGFLTTLPLIFFACFAPPAALLTKKFGVELTIFAALVLITFGIVVRSLGSVEWLFIGTAMIGLGVCIGNVLLPIIVKRDFPMKVALMTSSYVLAMGVASASASAFSIPLAQYHDLGWQWSLAALSVVGLVAMVVWLPQLAHNQKPSSVNSSSQVNVNLWTQKLAWQVAFYLGSGSFFTYTLVAWLPSILAQSGYSASEAGVIHGVFQIGTALPGLFVIPLVAKLSDQRLPAVGICVIAGLSTVGLLYLPQLAYMWSFLLGLTSGAWFILGLSFISFRTSSPVQATTLSGMAQFLGYSLAAIGPMLAGYLHSLNDGWIEVMVMIVSICLISSCLGLFAGRNIVINEK